MNRNENRTSNEPQGARRDSERQGGRVKFAIVSEGKLRCYDNGVKVFEIDLSPRVATLLAKDLLDVAISEAPVAASSTPR